MPSRDFVARPRQQALLEDQLRCDDESREHKLVVIHGLGGAGKSQLALKYLEDHHSRYTARFWIEAGSQGAIERDFRQMYGLLYPTRETSTNMQRIVPDVKAWLEGTSGRRLVVFDGADEIENHKSPLFVDLAKYLPRKPGVHIIVTSRILSAGHLSALKPVKVHEMRDEEAINLFRKASQVDDQDNGVRDIIHELGNFALAIRLAASQISDDPELALDLTRYLEKYRSNRKEVLGLHPDFLHQYGESVLTAWETSFNAVERVSLPASRLLTSLSFLDANNIFPDLFRESPAENGAQQNDAVLQSWHAILTPETSVDMQTIKSLLRTLSTHSFIDRDTKRLSYSMHKLVHSWGEARLTLEERRAHSSSMLRALADAIRRCPPSPHRRDQLVPHVAALFRNYQGAFATVKDRDDAAEDIETLDCLLRETGRWPLLVSVRRHTHQMHQHLQGDDHPSTISALSDLASALGNQGQLDEAASMKRLVLDKRQQTLGNNDPDTISAINNLANTLGDQGHLDQAAAMQRHLLEKMQQVLGNDHPSTISAKNNLASTLNRQGHLDQAASMQRQVLDKRQRVLGDDHADAISAMSNLASTLNRQGQLDQAAAMQRQVLEKTQHVLGNDHPNTISALSNLSSTLSNQGRLDQAATMKRQVLEQRRRVLGHDHPDTLSAMHNLANTLFRQAKFAEATSLERQTLEKMQQVLGDEHPSTGKARNSLDQAMRLNSNGT